MIPELPTKKISACDRLRKELMGTVQLGYIVTQGNPLECMLGSADDFHRVLQTHPPQSGITYVKHDPALLAFTAQFKWGTESGYRHVRFELNAHSEAAFRSKYGAKYQLPK